MCNYTPKEATKEENTVKIALGNGKVFNAGIVDVIDNGEKIHIVRLHKGRIVRREVLKIGYGFGDAKIISRSGCRYILKGTNGDNVLPGRSKHYNSQSKTIMETNGILDKVVPSREFLEFKREQDRFFKTREVEGQRLNREIMVVDRK
ncbi:MAG: hypothetical protein M0R80_03890 [Proteobacteria bacterium]|jgi:hypothetical protein|nr:hypothetical protein [Pseudomonadota bacterium]